MGRILISAPRSGSGKTVITMALLSAWKKQGQQLHSFKCGPDYIDPMFHSKVLGIPCRNLDSYLFGWADVAEDLSRVERSGLSVIEGAMGLYDGLGGKIPHSAYDLAKRTHTPIVVILSAAEDSNPKAALEELLAKDLGGWIRGYILNHCEENRATQLQQELMNCSEHLQCYGYFPTMKEAELSSRHLGLVTAQEVSDFETRMNALTAQAADTIQIDAMKQLADTSEPLAQVPGLPAPKILENQQNCCRIGIAMDEAFCFYYERSKEHLEMEGATLVPFSPLHDAHLPADLDGLYLGGGYPELYAQELEANKSIREDIRNAIAADIPTLAECGGFLYLGQKLSDAGGQAYDMVGTLPGEATKQEKLVRFGYAKIEPVESSMIFTAGDSVPIHEFHYWDSTDNGSDLVVNKASKGQTWQAGFANNHMYAGFPHIYLNRERARRFVAAAMEYRSQKKWDALAKPLRSLGRMETLINQVAGITGKLDVTFSKPRLYVVCADNGVIEEGVSQSDASVTAEVAYSLAKGESTVCHLAKQVGCEVVPVNAGMSCYTPTDGVWEYPLGKGTGNLRWEAAMTWNQVLQAFANGEELVRRAIDDGCDVLLLGEMGIGNTTTSSAMAAALLELPAEAVTGRGAGLSDEGLRKKIYVIEDALRRHGHALTNPMDILMFLGGFDIATLIGILFGAEKYRMPVILDGFITDVAALTAVRMNPDVKRVILPSHLSQEPACVKIYEELGLEPLITADMHLGEGSGAVMTLGLFLTALAVYNSGHTFGELGIEAYTLQK